MKKLHLLLLFITFSGLNINVAQSSVLNFDDVTGESEAAIANGYGGLNWSNFWVQNPELNQIADFNSGFYNGVVSNGYTAFNANGGAAEISSAAPFDFNDAYFTAASRWGLDITATGYRNGSLLYQQQFTVNTNTAQLFTLNFTAIDRLEFVSSGGQEYIGSGLHFTMDNASITPAAVPVPAAAWLFGSALAGFIGFKRRKA